MDNSLDDDGSRVSFDGDGLRLDTAEDAEQICERMTGKNIKILILQGNTFNIEAAERVGHELSTQTSLKEAHFKDLFTSRGREIVPDAMKHLLKGISDSGARLTLLDLSDNAIGPIGAPSVIEFLKSESALSLEKLYLHNCGLGPEGSSSISEVMERLKHLREFVCGRNRLENKGARSMSDALSKLDTLEVLRLNQNGIFVDGIKELAGLFEKNIESLQEIDLSDNTIKTEGAEALSKAISKSSKLHTIRLDDALLENEGFSVICDALSKSPALHTMKMASFEGNELHGDKVSELIELTFHSCPPEFTLNLLENEFTPEELMRLEELSERFTIYLDDVEEDSDYDDNETDEDVNESGKDVNESGKDVDESGKDVKENEGDDPAERSQDRDRNAERLHETNEERDSNASDNDPLDRDNLSFCEMDKLGILFEKLEIQ